MQRIALIVFFLGVQVSAFALPHEATRPPEFQSVDKKPYFDMPITYNTKVKKWINYFQTDGKRWYQKRLERSYRYLPHMQRVLEEKRMPKDLAYLAMIESGFSPHAVSDADAVGYWQFIATTANRYGLKTSWWLDERKDFSKSTEAAAQYLADLYRLFDSWYLTAAAYNMGEGRTRKLVNKYGTKNFWALARKRDFPAETRDYIPKMLAAMLIAKSPKLYGFNDVRPMEPYRYEYFHVPGGTDLINLSTATGIDREKMMLLNPELIQGFIPEFVRSHKIRIPLGSTATVSQYIRTQLR